MFNNNTSSSISQNNNSDEPSENNMQILLQLYALQQQQEQMLAHRQYQQEQQEQQWMLRQNSTNEHVEGLICVENTKASVQQQHAVDESSTSKTKPMMRIVLSEKNGISKCEIIETSQEIMHDVHKHHVSQHASTSTNFSHEQKIIKPAKIKSRNNQNIMSRVRSVSSTSSSSSSSTSSSKIIVDQTQKLNENENGIKLSVVTMDSYREEMKKNLNRPKRGRGRPRKN
ncbi:predicted protein [Naegleria gruberi]|uniref:Predicted protein n=1 Tax=Naegleria gruberi TaxID=5762 RepID=D2VSF9_NAEGR|nr:uncharacterized protein NAEGRDRAFT_71927 [Naegleria gruberi]EFC40185.1 predicted protein [Naegleria gruberi]|eukprot:XP_002672929.1 predicted protein [Naegleria gruberi strain NEG-M]